MRKKKLTPGSETEAWTNEEKQMKNIYAKTMGIAGEILCHSQGAEKMKKSTAGNTTKKPVAIFTGRSLAFCHLPLNQNLVFPGKY
jgi:hypothetical protein